MSLSVQVNCRFPENSASETTRDADLVVAEQVMKGVKVAVPLRDALIRFIKEKRIGAVIIDPFVSSHRVPENDNNAIDLVAKAWGRIANATGCAVVLVHHMRKTSGGDVSVEDGRGAVALLAAARHARTLRPMSADEANRHGAEQSERRAYVRVESGKANLSPLGEAETWFRLANVRLPNGDYVQAASPWTPPDPFDGVRPADLLRVQQRIDEGRNEDGDGWRASDQTGEAWVGNAIGEVLGLDPTRRPEAARIRGLLRRWLKEGLLKKVDHTINPKGRKAPFVEVGRWAEV